MIAFNNIPNTIRTPGAYTEIDNSRALQGLSVNPHKALLIGQKLDDGTGSIPIETLTTITSDGLADGYFGNGSVLARMCKTFKANNPNTELHAIALSNDGGVRASGSIKFSIALSHATGEVSTANEQVNMLINGTKVYFTLTSNWSVLDVNSAAATAVNANSLLPVVGSHNAASAFILTAVQSGTLGNYIDFRFNYFTGESSPTCFGDSATIAAMDDGATDPDLGDAWAVIANEQYQYIVQPYLDATNLTELEDELETRFGPLVDLQGYGFLGVKATVASATTLGNTRNSPHNTIMCANESPTAPEEWGAALGAVAAGNLNNDPARPLHYLKLKNVLAPSITDRYTRAERDVILYDGVATWITDSSDNVLVERCITSYQSNAAGIADASYLDIQTLFTLMEIRYQYKARMVSRFIVPRFKLASNSFAVQPGTKTVTPNVIKQEIIALFSELGTAGLVENLDDFVSNLIVERNSTDKTRVDVLLPPDLINQFRILATVIQFIL